MMKKLLLFFSILMYSFLLAAQTPTVNAKNQNQGDHERGSGNYIKVFPNPAINDITIDLGSNYQRGKIRIYTIAGNEVLEQEITSMDKIDISHLRDGFYFYELFADGKLIYVGRIIKK